MQLKQAAAAGVSNFLLAKSRERGDPITNLKLQKLLYYAQAWFLALHDREIFPEDFEAGVHGPVLPSQYHRFKHNDWKPISDPISVPSHPATTVIAKHLDQILDIFGTETAPALELMTHRERPWIDARRGLSPTAPSKNIISKSSMKKFYRALGKAT